VYTSKRSITVYEHHIYRLIDIFAAQLQELLPLVMDGGLLRRVTSYHTLTLWSRILMNTLVFLSSRKFDSGAVYCVKPNERRLLITHYCVRETLDM